MSEVEVPKFHELFVPALRASSGGTVMAAREVVTAVADELALSPEQRGSRIPSGQRRLDNRVNWALSYLFQARAVAKRGRGQYEVTQRGRGRAVVGRSCLARVVLARRGQRRGGCG